MTDQTWYRMSLADVELLADVVAELDAIKNLVPSECPGVREAAVLVARGHNTLQRVLGSDAHLIYSPESNEVNPT